MRRSGLARVSTRGCWIVALPRLRRIAMRNLELAYPEKTLRRAARDRRRSFPLHRAPALAHFARFPNINRENISQWIRYDGLEHFLEAKKAGRGVLFATAHLGNWELSAFAHALMTEPMNIVIRPLDNPGDRSPGGSSAAQLSGNRLIEKRDARASHSARAAAQRSRRHSDRSEHVACRKASSSISSVRRPAPTRRFAKIAHHTGARVIPGFALGWKTNTATCCASSRQSKSQAMLANDTARIARGPGKRDSRVSRPVAVDPPALENAAARRAVAL